MRRKGGEEGLMDREEKVSSSAFLFQGYLLSLQDDDVP